MTKDESARLPPVSIPAAVEERHYNLESRRPRSVNSARAIRPPLAEALMCRDHSVTRLLLTLTLSIGAVGCGRSDTPQPAAQTAPASRQSHQDWPTGHYQVVEGWPKPLPDTRHSHDGWTWGSVGAVYAENPDRIWIAKRGELPLPTGAKPWTPYAALTPSRGNATGNTDGLTATCEPEAKRGWERRCHHSIFVVDRATASWSASGRSSTRCSAAAVRPRAAQDQDEPVRSREARLDHRRPAARDLQVHLRREAGA